MSTRKNREGSERGGRKKGRRKGCGEKSVKVQERAVSPRAWPSPYYRVLSQPFPPLLQQRRSRSSASHFFVSALFPAIFPAARFARSFVCSKLGRSSSWKCHVPWYSPPFNSCGALRPTKHVLAAINTKPRRPLLVCWSLNVARMNELHTCCQRQAEAVPRAASVVQPAQGCARRRPDAPPSISVPPKISLPTDSPPPNLFTVPNPARCRCVIFVARAKLICRSLLPASAAQRVNDASTRLAYVPLR